MSFSLILYHKYTYIYWPIYYRNDEIKLPEASLETDNDHPVGAENAESEQFEQSELRQEFYPGAGICYGRGQTFLDNFSADAFSEVRNEYLYYPFASRRDWEVGSWLMWSGLSMAAVSEFLAMDFVSYSFKFMHCS